MDVVDKKQFLPGFNVRSYGILIAHPPKGSPKILLSQELIAGKDLTKFPGGGVEFLEPPADTVVREFAEELSLNVKVTEIFYVSPHFHRSFFRPQQFIPLYWRVEPIDSLHWDKPFPKIAEGDRTQQGFWQDLSALDPAVFTHPVDREIATLIKAGKVA